MLESGTAQAVAFERIRSNAELNEQRPAGYYGASAEGYTDYPYLKRRPHCYE